MTKPTIAAFELGTRRPFQRTLADLRRAFEAGGEKGGVVFLDAGEASQAGGVGARLAAGPETAVKGAG